MQNATRNNTIGLGLLGLGTVASGVVRILQAEARELEKRTGLKIELRKVCVRSLSKSRVVKVSKSLFTKNPYDVINDPSVDIVVELMGGIHPARELVLKALANGKHVVTANKALLAEKGDEVFGAAAKYGRFLGMEASVCGGIPILKALREGLVSNRIESIHGIVNGTCNYVLTGMSRRQLDFAESLKEAQAKGFAEKDPSFDIDGIDSAHKLAILARLAFGVSVPFKTISVQGIRGISIEDISYAADLGYVVKLLAIAKRAPEGIELRVQPTLLPFGHPLSNVWDEYNAVLVHANQAGDQLFYGRGAGMMPTASAVMSDVIDIGKRLSGQVLEPAVAPRPDKARMLEMGEVVSSYYLRFQVADKPGVLGHIARTLGKNQISILSVNQKESRGSRSAVPVVILTYGAKEKNVKKALRQISSDLGGRAVMMRVEK